MHTQSAPGTSQTQAEIAVRRPAAALVAGFGNHAVETDVASVAPDATFDFYNNPCLFGSPADYRCEGERWEKAGFHLDACRTLDTDTCMLTSDAAVLTHRLHTQLAGFAEDLHERESIVVRCELDRRWLHVHKHVSAEPAGADAQPQPA